MQIGISDRLKLGRCHIVYVYALITGNEFSLVGKGHNGHIEIYVGVLSLKVYKVLMNVGDRRIDLPDPLALH